METGIKATFYRLKDAKRALAEMEYLRSPEARIKLYNLKNKKPEWLSHNVKINTFSKYITIGAAVGFIIGFALMLFLQQLAAFEYVRDWNIFLFSVPFLAIGIVCSSLIYFIRREKIVYVNPDDAENDEALISVYCESENVSLFEKIMRKYHADNIITA